MSVRALVGATCIANRLFAALLAIRVGTRTRELCRLFLLIRLGRTAAAAADAETTAAAIDVVAIALAKLLELLVLLDDMALSSAALAFNVLERFQLRRVEKVEVRNSFVVLEMDVVIREREEVVGLRVRAKGGHVDLNSFLLRVGQLER